MFVVIGAGVGTGLLSLIYFALNGQAEDSTLPAVTTWPIGLVLLIVSVVLLGVGFRGLRYMSGGQALVHLILGGVLGFAIFYAALTGQIG